MPFALANNPSQSEISEAINYLLANFSAGTTVDPVTGQIIAPTGIIIGYLYKYLAVKYADSADGSLNFSNVPTNRTYFGLRNSNDAAESSNPADYIWTQATGGFGTTKFFWYSSTGGRQIQIAVATAAPATGWLQDTGASIDLDVVTSGNIPVIADTFFPYFTPAILQVPRTGTVLTPVFTSVNPVMYATDAGVIVPFTAAQTDSDVTFVNGTWRIGNSSTTGNGDISYTNLTIGAPTDAGDYAAWPNPTAMPASPAYITVPVRYKNSLGAVSQAGVATVQLVYADPGATGNSGTQYATAFLYQWSTTTPSNPSGSSSYDWTTGVNSGYTGGGSWQTTVGTNPGTPLMQLWIAQIPINATGGTTTTTVSWTSGFSISAFTQNGATGASGVQTARPTVYRWDISLPSGPTGTSTYTWSNGNFTAPAGWSTTITTSPSAGYTLWAASVSLVDSATATTSTINWTTAGIIASGYAGQTGATGTAGLSSRLTFARVAGNPTPVSGSITTSGSSSYPSSAQSSTTWGFAATWSASDPNPSSTNSLYQADGIYDPSTGNTVWSTPYISSLKVGTLSAITANTGNLTVSGTIQSNTAAISGTTMTGSGGVLYSTGNFAFGNSTTNITYNGTTMTINGAVVTAGNLSVGNLNSVSPNTGNLTVSGTITSGTAALSGSTFSGSGVVIYSTGQFAAGNTTNNIVWDNTSLTIKGSITGASNINITGTAAFNGVNTSNLYNTAVIGNSTYSQPIGVTGYTQPAVVGYGVYGYDAQTAPNVGAGVYGVGEGNGAAGVRGLSNNAGGFGLRGTNTAGGSALDLSSGTMTTANSTVVTNLNANYLQGLTSSAFATTASGNVAYASDRLNGSAGVNVLRFVQGTVTGSATASFSGTNKPGSASSNVWIQITIDGTTLYIPAWT